MKSKISKIAQAVKLLFCIYGFLIAIKLIAVSFNLASSHKIGSLVQQVNSPIIGLFIGILTTSLVQSSSSTTSLTVALVVSGTLPMELAIYIVMGANIGTCITNVLVSLTHITRKNEFIHAFAAAIVQNFFNLMSVVIIFPLEYFFGYLTRSSAFLTRSFDFMGGMTLFKPLDWITSPPVSLIKNLLNGNPYVIGLLAMVLLFFSLRQMVVLIKQLVLGKIKQIFGVYFFKNYGRAMLSGTVITAVVQSSSVTTSLAVPFAAAKVLTLEQIFPYTLGANIGTTVTTMLASLSLGSPQGLQIALAHLIFNITGIILISPVRKIPIGMARLLSRMALKSRLIPLTYVIVQFFIIPLIIVFFGR